MQHCVSHVNQTGHVVLLMPSSVQFESGTSGRIRQGMIRAGLLDAVIALPPGLLHFTGIGTTVLIFRKGRPTKGGMPADTLMINLENLEIPRGRRSTLPTSVISETLSEYRAWCDGVLPSVDYAKAVSYDDIANSDFNISPRRFVQPGLETLTADELSSRRASALDALRQSMDEMQRRDGELLDLLKERR
jgi:type I restriction enzyme M protein